MFPETLKTMIRGPKSSTAARKLPVPLLFRFVTSMTFPPLPPTELAPKPSAPGNAGREKTVVALTSIVKNAIHGINKQCIINSFLLYIDFIRSSGLYRRETVILTGAFFHDGKRSMYHNETDRCRCWRVYRCRFVHPMKPDAIRSI